LRQFSEAAGHLQIGYDPSEFGNRVNRFYLENKESGVLKDGYAPFCKHIFMQNFTDTKCGFLKITDQNMQYLKSFSLEIKLFIDLIMKHALRKNCLFS
jgi:hypothetical protein